MLVDLDITLLDLNGKELRENNLPDGAILKGEIAKLLAFSNTQAVNNSFSAIRAIEIALELNKNGKCELDLDGFRKLKDFIDKAPLTNLARVQITEALNKANSVK